MLHLTGKVAGGWEKDMSTGLMEAQSSEEVPFVTAWPCSPPSGAEAQSRRWQLQGHCGCVTAHKCCCHQQTAHRQHGMWELICCNRGKKEMGWNLKLCTDGKTSYISLIHHQQDLMMIPPGERGNCWKQALGYEELSKSQKDKQRVKRSDLGKNRNIDRPLHVSSPVSCTNEGNQTWLLKTLSTDVLKPSRETPQHLCEVSLKVKRSYISLDPLVLQPGITLNILALSSWRSHNYKCWRTGIRCDATWCWIVLKNILNILSRHQYFRIRWEWSKALISVSIL